MIGAFAPAAQRQTDLSDRMFNVRVPEFDAVVKAFAGTKCAPAGGSYVSVATAGSRTVTMARKWGASLQVASSEVRKGKEAYQLPVGLARDDGSALTPLVFDTHDLADMLLLNRLLGVGAEDIWKRSQLHEKTHDILGDDQASSTASQVSRAREAGLAAVAQATVQFYRGISGSTPAAKAKLEASGKAVGNFLISIQSAVKFVTYTAAPSASDCQFTLSGQSVHVLNNPVLGSSGAMGTLCCRSAEGGNRGSARTGGDKVTPVNDDVSCHVRGSPSWG